MSDLIERLRDRYSKHSQELRDEAAAEIERLREVAQIEWDEWTENLKEIERLRAALQCLCDAITEWKKICGCCSGDIDEALEKIDDENAGYIDKIFEQKRQIERLRELCIKAADEIERLRDALDRIAEGCDLSNEAQAIAREALREVGDENPEK